MTRSHKQILLLGLFLIAALVITFKTDKKEISAPIELEPTETESQVTQEASPATPTLESKPIATKTVPAIRDSKKPTNLSQKELISLSQLTQVMKMAVSPKATSQQMSAQLKKLGLTVLPSKDSNPSTGQMTILRTENALEGTRYFHSQSFLNEGKDEFFQHISFELRPSPDSLENAIISVKHHLPKDSQLAVNRPDYKLWKHSEGYITWIKVMTSEDLKGDPFNAYTAADVGTVRIVTELDIEEDHVSN